MLFAKGSRVRFIRTGDVGTIVDLLDDGMISVYLEKDQMTIPAFPEDLERIDQPSPTRARAIRQPPPEPAQVEKSLPVGAPQGDLNHFGIQLAFLPIETPDGLTGHFEVYLINDTTYPVVYTLSRWIRESVRDRNHGRMEPRKALLCGTMPFDELSDNPTYEVECWQITTNGTGPHLEKAIRLRPKQFFKKVRMAPFLNQNVHWYVLFESLQPPPQKNQQEDLLTYTQKNAVPPSHTGRSSSIRRSDLYDVRSRAEFIPEIDLHIEQLVGTTKGLSNADIIRIQLDHFRVYLEKALRVGVDRVFIIHGLGKGRLRDAIASELMQHPHVTTFKNEYHPRYGWGATEVIF